MVIGVSLVSAKRMQRLVKDIWRVGAFVTLCLGAASCSTLAGIDQDYREVEQPASDAGVGGNAGIGGTAGSGGGAGVGAAGASGSGGSSGAGGASGGTSGSGGSAGTGGGGGSGACAALGKQCVPALPSNWSGPVVLASGASTPPACGSDYPTQTTTGVLADNLSADPATCGCTCNNPVVAICATATLAGYSGGSCSGGAGGIIKELPKNSLCTAAAVPAVTKVIATGNFISGSCVPQPTEQVPAVTWGMQARACGDPSTAGACAGGEICVPPAPAATQSCVFRAGDRACPVGYPNKTVFYDGFDDTRGCTACTCGTATGNCDGTGTVSLHNKNDCTDSIQTITLGSCDPLGTTTSYAKYNDGPATNVTCPPAPGAGTPTGAATPKDPVTFCCLS